jgi:hypothetical protein
MHSFQPRVCDVVLQEVSRGIVQSANLTAAVSTVMSSNILDLSTALSTEVSRATLSGSYVIGNATGNKALLVNGSLTDYFNWLVLWISSQCI